MVGCDTLRLACTTLLLVWTLVLGGARREIVRGAVEILVARPGDFGIGIILGDDDVCD